MTGPIIPLPDAALTIPVPAVAIVCRDQASIKLSRSSRSPFGSFRRALSRSPRHRLHGNRTPNIPAARANPGPRYPRRTGQPSRQSRARPDAGRLCTRRSAGPGPQRRCRGSSGGHDRASTAPAPSSCGCSRRCVYLRRRQRLADGLRSELREDRLQGANAP